MRGSRLVLVACIVILAIIQLPRPAAATFADVTTTAGVGPPGDQGWVMGRGAAWGDCDGDGDVDLFAPNNGTDVLYRNLGGGAFAALTGNPFNDPMSRGVGAAWADYDNDRDQDLYVTNWVDGPSDTANRLFRNEGSCTFTDVTAAAGVGAAVWGTSVCWGDYNLDGWADLYVEDYEPARPNLLYRNNADGTFTDVTALAGVPGDGLGFACVWFDYDLDGWQDLYTVNDRSPLAGFAVLYRNNGDGTFSNVTAQADVANEQGDAMGVDVADYDNDGDFDIYVSNVASSSWPNLLYENRGNGRFQEVSVRTGTDCRLPTFDCISWGVGFLDYDRDGWKDLFVANGGMFTSIFQPDVMFHNEGQFTSPAAFTEVAASLGVDDPGDGRGAAFADYDEDGDVDIFVAHNEKDGRLYRNDVNPNHRWIGFRLEGTLSTREALGAIVDLGSGPTFQRQFVKAGSSYASDNGRDLLFGLGPTADFVTATVRWPTGLVDTLPDLAVNRMYTIVEPRMPAPVLVAPDDAAVVPQGDVDFQWVQAPSPYQADTFELVIADNPGFAGASSHTPVSSPFALPMSQPGVWYWRVRGLTSMGIPGDWSPTRTFRIGSLPPMIVSFSVDPTLIYPGEQSTVTASVADDQTPLAQVLMTIEYFSGTSWTSQFLSPPILQGSAFVSTFGPPTTFASGTYPFRAIARDGDGFESAPEYADLRVLSPWPEARLPRVAGFDGGSAAIMHIMTPNPSLGWTYFHPATREQAAYDVQVATVPAGVIVWSLSGTGMETQLTYEGPALAAGQSYEFRVRLFDGEAWGLWSMVIFHRNAAPPAPVLLSPPDGDSGFESGTVTLTWGPASDGEGDPVSYGWTLARDAALTDTIAQGVTTVLTADVQVGASTTYYWTVRGFDGWEWSNSNGPARFATDSSPPPPPPPGTEVLGRVSVLVIDGRGSPISGADISLIDVDGAIVSVGKTGANGRHTTANLSLGAYAIRAYGQSYQEATRVVLLTREDPESTTTIVLVSIPAPAAPRPDLGWTYALAVVVVGLTAVVVVSVYRRMSRQPH